MMAETRSEYDRGQLTRDKLYFVWKNYNNTDEVREYYAPRGAVVYWLGETRGEKAQEYYKTDVMYWVEFGGFEFGVREDEVRWETIPEV